MHCKSRLFFTAILSAILLLTQQSTCAQSAASDSVNYWIKQADRLMHFSDFSGQTDFALKALRHAERNGQPCDVALVYALLGKINYHLRNVTLSEHYMRRSKKLVDSANCNAQKAKANYNLAILIYELYPNDLKRLDSVENLIRTSLSLLDGTSLFTEQSKTHSILADIGMVRNYARDSIVTHLLEAQRFAELAKDTAYKAFVLSKWGKMFYLEKKFTEAENYFWESMNLYSLIKANEGIMHAWQNMAMVRDAAGKPGVYKILMRRAAFRDSLFNESTKSKIAEYQTRFDTEKKALLNKTLQQEIHLKQLQLQKRNVLIGIMIVLILLLVIIVVWRLSVISNKRKQQQMLELENLQKERERISRDLHDNVGGQLSYVLYAIDGIESDNSTKRKEVTGAITKTVRSVIGSLRETIWALNEEEITIQHVSDKLKVYAKNLFSHSQTKVSFKETIVSNKMLSSTLGLGLFRICQEALNNVLKHAEAKNLLITFKEDNLKLTIEIKDDGKGFQPEKFAEDSYGITNMTSRAAELHIEVDIYSSPGEGTTIVLIV